MVHSFSVKCSLVRALNKVADGEDVKRFDKSVVDHLSTVLAVLRDVITFVEQALRLEHCIDH